MVNIMHAVMYYFNVCIIFLVDDVICTCDPHIDYATSSLSFRSGIVGENEQAVEREIVTALKRDACNDLLEQAIFASLACSFLSTIPERKERLLVV